MWNVMGISCNIFMLGLFAAICSQKRGEAGLGMAGGAPGSPRAGCAHSAFSLSLLTPGWALSMAQLLLKYFGVWYSQCTSTLPEFLSCLTGHNIKAGFKASITRKCEMCPCSWEYFRSSQWSLLPKLQKMKTSTEDASLVWCHLTESKATGCGWDE